MGVTLTVDELKKYAEEHITYECNMLVGVLYDFEDWVQASQPKNATFNALIEDTLVHLRLLDDFFRQAAASAQQDDVTAQHYIAAWAPRDLLTTDERQLMNGQLHHLAARRTTTENWDLRALVTRACKMFIDFLDEVGTHEPARVPWFSKCEPALSDFR